MAVPLLIAAGRQIGATYLMRYLARRGVKETTDKFGKQIVTKLNKISNSYKGKDKGMVEAITKVKKAPKIGTENLTTNKMIKTLKKSGSLPKNYYRSQKVK